MNNETKNGCDINLRMSGPYPMLGSYLMYLLTSKLVKVKVGRSCVKILTGNGQKVALSE